MDNSQWRSKGSTDFKSQWMFSLLGGFLGGIVLVAVVVLLLPYIGQPNGPGASTSDTGIIATVLGSLAALLGVAIAAVFAIQWLFLDHRVTNALKGPVTQIELEMRDEFRRRVYAMTEFIWAWQNPNDEEKEIGVREALTRDPELVNAAAHMARYFVLRAAEKMVPGPIPRHLVPVKPELRLRLIDKAEEWANLALNTRSTHDPGYPDFVMACVLALQREPRTAIKYLSTAIKANDYFRSEVLSEQKLWDIFTGMTHGGDHLYLVERLLKIVHLNMPSHEEIRRHCEERDEMGDSVFDGVLRKSGDSAIILVRTQHPMPEDPVIQWRVEVGPPNSDIYEEASVDAKNVAAYIIEKYLITRKKPHPGFSWLPWRRLPDEAKSE